MKRVLVVALLFLLAFASFANAENTKISFGILPVLDTLPLQVAEQEGLFKKNGLDVDLIRFASALERDTAMQAGRIDGYFGDLVATYMLINQGVNMKIATVSWSTTPGSPMFGIAASPANKGKDMETLEGASIGLSKSTIMEYLLDRISSAHGFCDKHFERVEIKKIPIRMQMLLGDKIDGAILPEPLLSLVTMKGGSVVVTAEDLNMPLTVLCLADKYFEHGGEDYLKFIKAYSEAVKMLNENPEQYRDLMAKSCRIPPPLAPKFPIYKYPMPSMPPVGELDAVQDWMLEKGLLKERIANERVLPAVQP